MRGLKCGKKKCLPQNACIRVVLRSKVEKGVTSAIPRFFCYWFILHSSTCGVCVQARVFVVFRILVFRKSRSYMHSVCCNEWFYIDDRERV